MSGEDRDFLFYFKEFPQAFAQENNNCLAGGEDQGIEEDPSSQLVNSQHLTELQTLGNISQLKDYADTLLQMLSKAGAEV